MYKVSKWGYRVYSSVVFTFSAAILTLLICYKVTTTTVLIQWEHTVYVRNSIFLCIGFFLVCMSGLFLFVSSSSYERLKVRLEDDFLFLRVRRILLFAVFLISVGWVLCTQFVPGVDEGEVQYYVYLATQGNFEIFEPGKYMVQYPNQWGLFLLEYLMALLFGAQNYTMFGMLNSIAIVVIVYELSEIARVGGASRLCQLGIVLLGLLFLPLEFYSIYVYGNIPAMALALVAVKHQMLFVKNLKVKNALLCAAAISLAVWLKSTIEIYLVAIVLYGLIDAVINHKNGVWVRICGLAAIFAGVFLQSACTRAILENMTGQTFSNPVSSLPWIAMGLQDGELAPGWWNGYNRESYYACGNNTALQSQVALENIRESIRGFFQSPGYALSFFTHKITSTWMNPTFQCFSTVRNNVFIRLPQWVRNLLTYEGQYRISQYFNILLFLILVGALIDIILLYVQKEFTERSTLIMTFVGGFLFLIFWETKARYALMFVVTLFPYGVDGFIRVSILASHQLQRIRKGGGVTLRKQVLRRSIFPVVIVALVVSAFLVVYSFDRREMLTQDTAYYAQYLLEHGNDAVIPKIVTTKYSE